MPNHAEEDAGCAALMNEIVDGSPNDGFVTEAAVRRADPDVAVAANVRAGDSPEEASAKFSRALSDSFGEDVTVELAPEVATELAARKRSFHELKGKVETGQISEAEAGLEWIRRFGPAKDLPAAQAAVNAERWSRPGLSPEAMERVRADLQQSARRAIFDDPTYLRLAGIEAMLRLIRRDEEE